MQLDKSMYTAVIESETGDTGLTIIYGQIIERYCRFMISDVNVKVNYGKKGYFPDDYLLNVFSSDGRGNYIIEIRSLTQDLGLSFRYRDHIGWADLLVPIPTEYRGKQIKIDIELKLKFFSIECF